MRGFFRRLDSLPRWALTGALLLPLALSVMPTLAAASALTPETEALVRRVPQSAVMLMTADTAEDNPSVQVMRSHQGLSDDDKARFDAMNSDIREGVTRFMRLFGLNLDPKERFTDLLGPRFLMAVVPSSDPKGMPNLLMLSAVKNRAQAEKRITDFVSAMARNAEETTLPLNGGSIHRWSNFYGSKFKLNYFVSDNVAAISTDQGLLTAATSTGEVPAWLTAAAATVPRGVMNFYLSPKFAAMSPLKEMMGKNAPNLEEMGVGAQAGALTLVEEGLLWTQSQSVTGDGPAPTMLKGLSGVPALTDATFKRLPNGTLMVVAASAPAEWVKAVLGPGMMAMMAGGDKDDKSGMTSLMQMALTVFDGDVAVGLRALAPIPSPMVTVASADEASAAKKLGMVQEMARNMKLKSASVTLGGLSTTAYAMNKPPLENLYVAQLGGNLTAAIDRRTMMEAAALENGGATMLDDPGFAAARKYVGENARLMVYGDASALSGLGMMLSHMYFPGQPMGRYMANGFREMRGVAMGLELQPDRITSRVFLSGNPSLLLPAMAGATMAAVPLLGAVGMPVLSQSRSKAQTAECRNNMKQLAIAMVMYANDHDEHYPRANAWREALRPYMKDESILHCPADHGSGGYAMNLKLSGQPMARVMNPAGTVLFYETNASGADAKGTGDDLAWRHNGTHNVAYVDGHVETLSEGLTLANFRLEAPEAMKTAPMMTAPMKSGMKSGMSMKRAPRKPATPKVRH